MSNEELEKRMEFIIEQQAQSAAKMGQIEDIVGRLAKASLDRFETTDKRIDDVDERISALVDAQMRTEENGRKTDEKIAALVDAQIRTEEVLQETGEKLKSLIVAVDRYFSEDRNGKRKE